MALADNVVVGADQTKLAGSSGSFQVYLVEEDGPVADTLNNCNANDGNGNAVTVNFATTAAGVVSGPADAILIGCDDPATVNVVENAVTVNFSVNAAAAVGSTATITATASGGRTTGNNPRIVGTFDPDSITITVGAPVVVDPCAGVSSPSAPAISSSPTSPDGNAPWFVTTPTVSATSADATVTYSTDGTTYSTSAPTLGEGTTTVYAKAEKFGTDETTSCGMAVSQREFKVDTVAPTILPGDVTNTIWRNTDLSQAFTASDGTSGLAQSADATFTLTVSTESTNTTTPTVATKAVFDVAGNSTTRSLSALIDKTAPGIQDDGATTPPDGTNDWYTAAVLNQFTASDSLSGLPAGFTNPFTVSSGAAEGSAVTVSSGSVSDVAGNANPGIQSGPFKIDLSNPTDVAFVGGPAAGSSHYFGSVPAAPTCTADDAISQLASCVVTGHSTAVGNHTMTATATDNAGRTTAVQRSYSVLAWTLSGFYQPVDMNGVWNTVKGGSTVPLKFEVFAGSTELTSTAVVESFTTKSVTCPGASAPADEIEFVTTGGTAFRYDSTGGQFVQNWATPKKPGTCHTVTMKTDDESSITASFILK